MRPVFVICTAIGAWVAGLVASLVTLGCLILGVCKLIGLGSTAHIDWFQIVAWPFGSWVVFGALGLAATIGVMEGR